MTIEFFKKCVMGYRILMQNYERSAQDVIKMRDTIDLLDKTRFFIADISEFFKNI